MAVAAFLLAAAPALADTATLPDPESPNASAIDDIYRAVLGVTITIFVLVGGWLVYSAIRFRERRGRPEGEPPQFHGSFRLELGWTLVPILILAALSAYTFARLPDVKGISDSAMRVRVEGFQFGWNYFYPGNKAASQQGTLVLPVDRQVELVFTSRDVNHDWWVPQLGPKMDVIAGQTNHQAYTPHKVGTYTGQCAEFCGTGHAGMKITVRVVSQEQFKTYESKLKSS
jgi:cytochrome c oxidase subunit II